MPIAEAAHAAGFADQSHLTRHFKYYLGLTPGAYVRAMRPGPSR
jgi:AraC-like DNA-binding protein